jgi:ribose 5-phosphate isomerase A
MADPYLAAKREAGRIAADLVQSGMRLGFGTGSTFVHVLERLRERIAAGLEVVGVPTSEATATRARELGVPLCDLEDVDELDLAIDGADEVDRDHHLVKGGGGALMREKIVAAAAREMVVVVTANKLVDRLGTTMPLPVEVLRFGWRQAGRALAALGCSVRPRVRADGAKVVTDNGNYVLDCSFGAIGAPGELAARIRQIPGVLDHGLFIGMAGRIVVGELDGRVRMIAPRGS